MKKSNIKRYCQHHMFKRKYLELNKFSYPECETFWIDYCYNMFLDIAYKDERKSLSKANNQLVKKSTRGHFYFFM